jgi:hypothetical protein
MRARDTLQMRHVRAVVAGLFVVPTPPVIAQIAWYERAVGRIVRAAAS